MDEAPILPTGYVGLVDMVMVNNDAFVESAVKELRRTRLGPFAPDATPEELERLERLEALEAVGEEATTGAGPKWMRDLLGHLPAKLRPVLFWGVAVIALTFGAQLETGAGSGFDFWSTLMRNYVILAVFTGTFMTHSFLEKQLGRDGLAWIIAFAFLAVAGSLTDGMLG